MTVSGIDHIALPTADAARLLAFYVALGFDTQHVDDWRAGRTRHFALVCGDQKINVHPEQLVARRADPDYLRGPAAEPGCGDVCVVWSGGLSALLALLEQTGTTVIAGPVPRVGGARSGTATGISVYVRDPDLNLLEFISYDDADLDRSRSASS